MLSRWLGVCVYIYIYIYRALQKSPFDILQATRALLVQGPHQFERLCAVCVYIYMGGCQNLGPFLGPYYNTAPNI